MLMVWIWLTTAYRQLSGEADLTSGGVLGKDLSGRLGWDLGLGHGVTVSAPMPPEESNFTL